MAKSKEQQLVLSIYSGRNFPDVPVIIRANFDGNTLSTDKVGATTRPVFNHELGWVIDKKAWHGHRLQNTPIKLMCYQIVNGQSLKELGYVIISLRSVAVGRERRAEWRKLLGVRPAPFTLERPEVSFAVYLEDHHRAVARCREITPAMVPVKDDSMEDEPDRIAEEKDEDEALEVEEQVEAPKEVFTDDDLTPVLHDDRGYFQIGPDHPDMEHFWFSLVIKKVKDIPELFPPGAFLPEGYHFIVDFLSAPVESDSVQDVTDVGFEAEHITARVRSTEGRIREYLVRQKEIVLTVVGEWEPEVELGHALFSVAPVDSKWGSFPVIISGNCIIRGRYGNAAVALALNIRRVGPDCPEVMKRVPTAKRQRNIMTATQEPHFVQRDPGGHGDAPRMDSTDALEMEVTKDVGELNPTVQLKQYMVVFNLLSVLYFHEKPVQISFRYTYASLGLDGPEVVQLPAVLRGGSPGKHVDIPQGGQEFCVALTEAQLDTIMRRKPLKVDMVDGEDRVIATATAALGRVFDAPQSGDERTCDLTVPLMMVGGDQPGDCIGELSMRITVKDMGVFNFDANAAGDSKDAGMMEAQELMNKTVKELEMWKEKRQVVFERKLEEEKKQQLKLISDEWCKREAEREAAYQLKMSDMMKREKEFQIKLDSVEQQGTQMSMTAIELKKEIEETRRDASWKLQTAKEASRRLVDNYEHELSMERARYAALKEEMHILQVEVRSLRERCREKEAQVLQLPIAKLQQQVESLHRENRSLSERLETEQARAREREAGLRKLLRQAQTVQEERLNVFEGREEEEAMEAAARKGLGELAAGREVLKGIQAAIEQLRADESEENPLHQRILELVEEKDRLMATGMYLPHDDTVSSIDHQIRDLMSEAGLVE